MSSLPEPYWQDLSRGLRLFHGDCRDLLPTFADGEFGSVLLDPPYAGIAPTAANPQGSVLRAMKRPWAQWHPVDLWFDWMVEEAERIASGLWLFCNAQLLPSAWRSCWVRGGRTQLLVWDKGSVGLGTAYRSQTEFVVFHQDAEDITPFDSRNLFRIGRATGSEKLLPGQKPKALIREIIEPFPASAKGLCDPYAGTGTSLVVCAEIGVPCVGIEADEERCEMVAIRLTEDLSYGEPNLFNREEAEADG